MQLYLLLWLDKPYPTGVSLVHDTNVICLLVTEDIEIMINVIKCKNGLLDGDGSAQIKA